MQRYYSVIRDLNGKAIVNAPVTIFQADGVTPVLPANVFSPFGTISIGNPFVTNANGSIGFSAPDGNYVISIVTEAGIITQQVTLLAAETVLAVPAAAAEAIAAAIAAAASEAAAQVYSAQAGLYETYLSVAQATADLANIPANKWVEVESDETIDGGGITRYQNIAGALTNQIVVSDAALNILKDTAEGFGADRIPNTLKAVANVAAVNALTSATRAQVIKLLCAVFYGDLGSGDLVPALSLPSNLALGITHFKDTDNILRRRDWPSNEIHAAWAGVIYDGITDNTAAMNALYSLCCATGYPAVYGPGKVVHGRLTTLSAPLQIKCNRTEFIVSNTAWPYASDLSALIRSAYDYKIEGKHKVNQNWNVLPYTVGGVTTAGKGYPTGYSPAIAPTSWGGGFYADFNGAETIIEIDDCEAVNWSRLFLCEGVGKSSCTRPSTDCRTGYPVQIFMASQACDYAHYDDVQMRGPRWTDGGTGTGTNIEYGCTPFFPFGCTSVYAKLTNMDGFQWICVGLTYATTSLDIPQAKVAYCVGDFNASETKNIKMGIIDVNYSADCGITFDNCIDLDGAVAKVSNCHVGGLLMAVVRGGFAKAIVLNVAQCFSQPIASFGRYPSSAGAWLSAISVPIQSVDSGGTDVFINNGYAGFDESAGTYPPVSDGVGPIRNATYAIYTSPSTSTTYFNTVSAMNCRCQLALSDGTPMKAVLPNFCIQIPLYKMYTDASGLSAPSYPAELFIDNANAANSFKYLTDGGPSGYIFMKGVKGMINPNATFTGQELGAVVRLATGVTLQDLMCVETGNIDFSGRSS